MCSVARQFKQFFYFWPHGFEKTIWNSTDPTGHRWPNLYGHSFCERFGYNQNANGVWYFRCHFLFCRRRSHPEYEKCLKN